MMGAVQNLRPASAGFDVERVRADFPVLHQLIRGKPLVYLDNAATSQKPQAVLDAVLEFYRNDNANVHRGVHTLSGRATEAYEAARGKVQRFLRAAKTQEIVFVKGTTEGINLVAHSFVRPRLRAGDEILITAMEHHSNIVPWQLLCEEKGAKLKVAPITEAGELVVPELDALSGPLARVQCAGHHQSSAAHRRACPPA
jgi:cysteine desulfurase/selenocysteine lyase